MLYPISDAAFRPHSGVVGILQKKLWIENKAVYPKIRQRDATKAASASPLERPSSSGSAICCDGPEPDIYFRLTLLNAS
jgi:hypothetical protein